jgi:hypothetical protein
MSPPCVRPGPDETPTPAEHATARSRQCFTGPLIALPIRRVDDENIETLRAQYVGQAVHICPRSCGVVKRKLRKSLACFARGLTRVWGVLRSKSLLRSPRGERPASARAWGLARRSTRSPAPPWRPTPSSGHPQTRPSKTAPALWRHFRRPDSFSRADCGHRALGPRRRARASGECRRGHHYRGNQGPAGHPLPFMRVRYRSRLTWVF